MTSRRGPLPASAWLLALAPLLAAAARPGQSDSDLRTVLARACARGGDAAEEEIAALGPEIGPAVLALLASGELDSGVSLDHRCRAVLLSAAGRLGREPFASSWGQAALSTDGRMRRAAIELIGATGSAADLASAVQAATPPTPGQRLDPAHTGALEDAVDALLDRDPEALLTLRASILHSSPDLAGHLIRGAARDGSEKRLHFLGELLGFTPGMDACLFSHLACLARELDPPFEDDLCLRVRSYLVSGDRQLVRGALAVLAELEDPEAIEELLELAATPDAVLSEASYLALERTCALALPRRVERWRAWHASERDWFARRASHLPRELGRSAPEVVATLREIAAHRLRRHELASLVMPLLGHQDPRLRLEACRTLEGLASATASEALSAALEDPDPAVRAAAGEALTASRRRPAGREAARAGS